MKHDNGRVIHTGRYALRPGTTYHLSGMRKAMWDKGHPFYGRPMKLDAVYLGCLKGLLGKKTWHVFELHLPNREEGVVVMSSQDLNSLIVTQVDA